MAPKKAPATKEIKVQEPETPEDTGKKAPPKRVRKPKEDTNKDVVLSDNIKLSMIKKEFIELTEQSEELTTKLEALNTKRQMLCDQLLGLFSSEPTTLKDDKNTFILDKPSSSGSKTSNIKVESDSSNDKESSDNDTNSDEEIDTKAKPTKGKNGKSQPNIKSAPVKTSRAKPKTTPVPVLESDESDSD